MEISRSIVWKLMKIKRHIRYDMKSGGSILELYKAHKNTKITGTIDLQVRGSEEIS